MTSDADWDPSYLDCDPPEDWIRRKPGKDLGAYRARIGAPEGESLFAGGSGGNNREISLFAGGSGGNDREITA